MKNLLKPTNYFKAQLYQILDSSTTKSEQLHLQEPRECNWMFNIGEILKTDIVMTVTTNTNKKSDKE